MRVVVSLSTLALASLLVATSANAVQDVQTAYTGLTSVSRLRFDSGRNLFATERTQHRVVKIAFGTTTPVSFATGFLDPSAMGIDSHDNIFVANYQGANVHKVTPSGAKTVFASGFVNPFAMAIDDQDNVYVGELLTQDVYKITPSGAMTFYGNANLEPTAPSGPNTTSRLTALAFDRSGSLYCGTYGNGTGFLGPFALSVIPPGGGAGVRKSAVSQPIVDFAPGPTDDFYTAGYQLDRIGRLSLTGSMLGYAGSGVAGLLNGPLPTARFSSPSGVALDPVSGYLYVADWNNGVVRVIRDDITGPTDAKRTTWGRLKDLYH